jgi:hypothetical protein
MVKDPLNPALTLRRKDTFPAGFSILTIKDYEDVTWLQHGCATKKPRPPDGGRGFRKLYAILNISSGSDLA